MSIATISAYAFALFVVALIPGPGITALVARSLGSGFTEALAMAAGLILGDLVFLTAVLLGLSVLAQTFGTAFLIVKYLGVVYLAWVAYKIWTSGLVKTEIGAAPRKTIFQAALSGLLVTLGNPKAMLFYVALVPTILDIHQVTMRDFGILAVVTTLVLVIVVVPYIALASRVREMMRHPRSLKMLNRASASFLALTAGYIAIRSH